MPGKKPSGQWLVWLTLATFAVITALAVGMPEGQARLRFFALGMRCGAEDRQSGITYASDAPGLKVWRSSFTWTPNDKALLLRFFASSPEEETRAVSAFMAGYKCGFMPPVYWLAISLPLVLLVVVIVRRRAGRAAKGSLS